MDKTRKYIRQFIPCIRVNDVRSTMDYYICELGFKPRYYLGGNPESGGVEIDDIPIDFISGDVVRGDVSLNFLVENIEELYESCRKRGLDIILKPRTTNGMRLFGINDPNGYRLFFFNWVDKKKTSLLKNRNRDLEIPERFKDSIIKAAVSAIEQGDVEVVKKLIAIDTSIVTDRISEMEGTARSFTLLHVVTNPDNNTLCQRSAELAETLVKAGCEIDALDRMDSGNTPLQLLLCKPVKSSYRYGVAKVLIEAGARVGDHNTNDHGFSAFNLALLNGYTEEARLMFDKVVRPGFVWVAGFGDINIVKSFFEDRKSDKFKNAAGYYLIEETSKNYLPEKNMATLAIAFILASINSQNEIIEFLLDKGVDINVMVSGKNFIGIAATALHWASFHGHGDTVNLLIKRGANIRALDNSYSLTPAAWAAKGGDYELSNYLKSLENKLK